MTTDLNTLLTALYVKIDDWLGRPRRTGRPPKLSDAELLTLAVAQVLLGVRSEARWLRFVPGHLPGAFP
ncbi:IS982 family transposase, partial [Micromonospora sp. NPDC003241]